MPIERRRMSPQPNDWMEGDPASAYICGIGNCFWFKGKLHLPPSDMPGARPVLVGEEWFWEAGSKDG